MASSGSDSTRLWDTDRTGSPFCLVASVTAATASSARNVSCTVADTLRPSWKRLVAATLWISKTVRGAFPVNMPFPVLHVPLDLFVPRAWDQLGTRWTDGPSGPSLRCAGNTAAAAFNAVLGNLLGVVATPALLLLLVGQRLEMAPSLLATFKKLGVKVREVDGAGVSLVGIFAAVLLPAWSGGA